MGVSEVQNPGDNPGGGWFGDSAGHRKAALKGKRRKKRKRRRRNPSSNPATIPLLAGITAQDIAVGGASFLLVQKVGEMAGQTGWADVGVKALAAIGCGMVAEAALPASKRYAIVAGMLPAALGSVALLTNGQWGMVTTGSAHITTGGALRNPVDPIRVVPSPMGI